MTVKRLICLVFFLGSLQGITGQDQALRISGQFLEASFKDFATSVGEQTGIRFFYKDSWVHHIRVSLTASDLPLMPLLDSILQPAGLNYFMDEWMHLFLSNSSTLIASLPEYQGRTETIAEEVEPDMPELTAAEQNYIDGRKDRAPEVIEVGSADRSTPGKNTLVTGHIYDDENGEPLIGATVYIASLGKGTATGLDGRFSMLLKPGSYGVECNNMGMEALRFTLLVHSAGDVTLNMTRTLIALDEVVVTAGQHDNVSGNQMGYERLNYSILKQVPLVMGERDIIKVVK